MEESPVHEQNYYDYDYLTVNEYNVLRDVIEALISPGRGIISIDETPFSLGNRMAQAGIEDSSENRFRFYKLMSTLNAAISTFVSGIVFNYEAVCQSAEALAPLIRFVETRGLIPGIRLDKGVRTVPGFYEEYLTLGLDDLERRCVDYRRMGFSFAKWRCIYKMNDLCPSRANVVDNAYNQARFITTCQLNGMVPIIQLDLLTDGDHCLSAAQGGLEHVLSNVFCAIQNYGVYLDAMLLEVSLVTKGDCCPDEFSYEQNALAAMEILQRRVPAVVPGIFFLSGKLPTLEALHNLNAIARCADKKPWTLSFSFGRSMLNSVLKLWSGKNSNVPVAQREVFKICKACSEAALGNFCGNLELEVPGQLVFNGTHIW